MKRSFRRILSLLIAGFMTFSLTACGENASNSTPAGDGSQTTASSGKKVIKFFHRFPDEPYNSFIESKIEEYEASHPDIDIVVESAQNDPYKEKIKVVVGGDNCPDIFFSWCGEFSERFLREGLLLDLTPYFDADTAWKDSLMEAQLINYENDGVIYGVPFRLDCKLFFYNMQMFKENNLEVPKTWDDFITVCQKLKDASITPIAYGNQELWPSAHYVGTLNQMLVSDEVRAVDYEPTTGAFTDPGYQKALEYYEQLIPFCNDAVNGTAADMSRTNFAMNKAAMYYAELIEIPYITALNADLDYGMFNFPVVEGPGNPDILTGAPEGFVVSSATKYPEECVEFLKWFLGPEVGKQQAQEIGWFNASKGVVNGVTDQKLIDGYNVVMNAERMGPWFDNVLYSTVCDVYLTATSDITNGDLSPADAMEKIQEVAQEAQKLAGAK